MRTRQRSQLNHGPSLAPAPGDRDKGRMMGLSLVASAVLMASGAYAQTAPTDPAPNRPASPIIAGAAPDVPVALETPESDMGGMGGMGGMMSAMLGHYPMPRDGSGTSWVPDAALHAGLHTMHGPWMFMEHLTLNAIQDWQDGPRGGQKAFVSGMAMGLARRSFANGDILNFRIMLSPEPVMGPRGYPLLLASGETADGKTPLIDRQHPHNLVMEASASFAKRLTDETSAFVYAGLPGEPAFGPPAFMHRPAGMDDPQAPITHHWLDSTHISNGVVTAGLTWGDVKLEASRFRGREPDQHRYNVEIGALDSTALRASWNPNPALALQVSWADQKSPEQLAPEINERRWSASALLTHPLFGGVINVTGAFGQRQMSTGVVLNGWLSELAFSPNANWTVFARAERARSIEFNGGAGPPDGVGEISLGAVRDWRIADHLSLGLGALVSKNSVDRALTTSYGGHPNGAMGFVRLKVS